MNFCSDCGARVELIIPEGDHLPRHVCLTCNKIHYHNPRIVAGAIPEWQGKLLLCRRAIEPRYGYWTLPAGFMENNETTAAAAVRETYEEACADVKIDGLYTIFSMPHASQVYMLFRATLKNPKFAPGAESLEAALVEPSEIPWRELAFPAVHESLRLYVNECEQGRFGVHVGHIEPVDETRSAYRIYLEGKESLLPWSK